MSALKPSFLDVFRNNYLVCGLLMVFSIVIAVVMILVDDKKKHTTPLDVMMFIFVMSTLFLFYRIIDDTALCIPSGDTITIPR